MIYFCYTADYNNGKQSFSRHIIQRGNNRQNIFFEQEDGRLYLKWQRKI